MSKKSKVVSTLNFGDMPQDCLFEVFRFLHSKEVCKLMTVSKNFKEFIEYFIDVVIKEENIQIKMKWLQTKQTKNLRHLIEFDYPTTEDTHICIGCRFPYEEVYICYYCRNAVCTTCFDGDQMRPECDSCLGGKYVCEECIDNGSVIIHDCYNCTRVCCEDCHKYCEKCRLGFCEFCVNQCRDCKDDFCNECYQKHKCDN